MAGTATRIRPFTTSSWCAWVLNARTKEYVAKRTLEGKGKSEIMRCLRRYVARELYRQIMHPAPAPVISDLRPLRRQLGLRFKMLPST